METSGLGRICLRIHTRYIWCPSRQCPCSPQFSQTIYWIMSHLAAVSVCLLMTSWCTEISALKKTLGTFKKILMPCRCGNGVGSWSSTQKMSSSPHHQQEKEHTVHIYTSMVNSSSQQTHQHTLVSILRRTWTGQITSKQSLKSLPKDDEGTMLSDPRAPDIGVCLYSVGPSHQG